jgi:putative hydrolase of the HAD superfamily
VLVLFDLDDTLLDDGAATRSAARRLHGRVRSKEPFEAFHKAWGHAIAQHFPRYLAGELTFQGQRRERLRQVVDASLSDDDADRLFDEYHAEYQAAWTVFPDVLPCLSDLSHVRVGVITNGNGQQQRLKLQRTGLIERFACVVISEECGFAKPNSEVFLHACELGNEKPGNVIYVGDRYDTDAVAARSAGLQGIWLDRKRQASAHHLPPTIETLRALPALVQAYECPLLADSRHNDC